MRVGGEPEWEPLPLKMPLHLPYPPHPSPHPPPIHPLSCNPLSPPTTWTSPHSGGRPASLSHACVALFLSCTVHGFSVAARPQNLATVPVFCWLRSGNLLPLRALTGAQTCTISFPSCPD